MSIQGSRTGSGARSEVASLLAARRPAALRALERELEGRQPDADTLIRLAELLARGGRRSESARLLRGVIEQQASAGRLARALAALKRLERLGASDDALVEGLAQRVLEGLPPQPVPVVEEPLVEEPVVAVAPPAEAAEVDEVRPAGEPEAVDVPPPSLATEDAAPEEARPVETPLQGEDPAPPAAAAAEEPRASETGEPASGAEPGGAPEGAAPETPEPVAEAGASPEVAPPTTSSGAIEIEAPRPSGMAFRLRTVFRFHSDREPAMAASRNYSARAPCRIFCPRSAK